MNYQQLSQFTSANALIMAEDTSSITVASQPDLLDELRARGTDLIAVGEGLDSLRATLEIPHDIRIGLTFIRVADAAELEVGREFLADNPDTLGFCFSSGDIIDGHQTLEVFVAIDPVRVPATEHDLTDELVEKTLDLNHYFISQLILALDPYDSGDDTDELTEEQIDAYEERATEVLNALLEAETPPFAIVPHDDTDEDDE